MKYCLLLLGGNVKRFQGVIDFVNKHGVKSTNRIIIFLSVSPRQWNLIDERWLDRIDKRAWENIQIYVDLFAIDTLDNFVNTKELILKTGVYNLRIVTGESHIDRAMIIARRLYKGSGVRLITYPVNDGVKAEPRWKKILARIDAELYMLTGRLPSGGKRQVDPRNGFKSPYPNIKFI